MTRHRTLNIESLVVYQKRLAPSCDWPTAIGTNTYNDKFTEQATVNVIRFLATDITWLYLFFLEYCVAHVSLRTGFETGSDFRKVKSRAQFSLHRASGSDFVKTFRSQARIFKQGSQWVLDFTICHPLWRAPRNEHQVLSLRTLRGFPVVRS